MQLPITYIDFDPIDGKERTVSVIGVGLRRVSKAEAE